jgi:hypothetical protein
VRFDGGRVTPSRHWTQPFEFGQITDGGASAPALGPERDGGFFADQLFELARDRGRLSLTRWQNRSNWCCVSLMFVTVMVRQKRWVAKWMDFSTDPLRLPRLGGQATTVDP